MDTTFYPYLPAQPIHGGHTIDSKAKLQSLLGQVGNPHISSLRVGVYTRLSGEKIHKFQPMNSHHFQERGSIVPCRGRGPFWQQNSCALDCVIVAARLLNLGITVADRGNATRDDWLKSLWPLERLFMGLIGIPWEGISNADSIVARHRFLAKFLNEFNHPEASDKYLIGDFLPAISIWHLCTPGMRQFRFSAHKYTLCSKCDKPNPKGTPTPSYDIALPQMNATMRQTLGNRPSMAKLLNLHFRNPEKDCRQCGSKSTLSTWTVVAGELPTRLVVLPDATYRDVAGATSRSIPIIYYDDSGQPNSATYRWLGGIYQYGGHYRVYWTDCKSNEESDNYMLYDGMMLEGLIVGGIVPHYADAIIPSHWSKGADILFYERTDPDVEAVGYAEQVIRKEVWNFCEHIKNHGSAPDPELESWKMKRKRSIDTSGSESETLQDELGITSTISKYRKVN